MNKHLLLSVSSEDKPGVVEKLSAAIESCGGNWLESRLANLRGKFVGVIWVNLSEDKSEALATRLSALQNDGILVQVDDSNAPHAQSDRKVLAFSIVGPDRTGIVKEVSLALSSKGINLEELETNLSSAPYSGEPIFEARGELSVPDEISASEVKDRLADIADELGMDLDLETD